MIYKITVESSKKSFNLPSNGSKFSVIAIRIRFGALVVRNSRLSEIDVTANLVSFDDFLFDDDRFSNRILDLRIKTIKMMLNPSIVKN